MKALLGVLGIITAGLLAYWLLIRKQVNAAVANTGGVVPPVGHNTAGPTLCETLAPLGGAVAAGAAGAPPQAGLAAGAVGAKPICNMLGLLSKVAAPLAKGAVAGAKAVESAAVSSAKAIGGGAVVVAKTVVNDPLKAVVTVPGYTLQHTIGAGINAVFGSSNKVDATAAAKLNSKFGAGPFGQQSLGCALKDPKGNWVDNSSNCVNKRKQAGVS